MGKQYEKVIDSFSGRTSDYRSKYGGRYALTKNFDVFSYLHKIVPHYGFEDNGASSTAIVKTLYANDGSTNKLFGLDKTSDTNRCLVRYWNGSGWVEPSNNTSGSGVRRSEVFFLYKGFIYMVGGNTLQRFDVTTVASFETSYQTLNATDLAQPVRHLADDCAYFFADNKVYRLDDATWDGVVLTLPSDLKIVGAAMYGDYLAIACTSVDLTVAAGARSFVYLWDRDSSLETVDQVVDFGQGVIQQFANLDNRLIAVMDTIYANEVAIKAMNGRFASTLNTLKIDTGATHTASSQVREGRMYFPMQAPLDNDDRFGIWAVDSDGRLEMDREVDGATGISGIYWDGDQWIVAAQAGSVFMTTAEAIAEGVYESVIIGEVGKRFKLNSVGIMTETGGVLTAAVYYRTEVDDSWTLIFSFTPSSNNRYHEAVNIEADGSELPEFDELQFRVVSKRPIVGIKYKIEEIDNNLS